MEMSNYTSKDRDRALWCTRRVLPILGIAFLRVIAKTGNTGEDHMSPLSSGNDATTGLSFSI
jgi:hypothetical protein